MKSRIICLFFVLLFTRIYGQSSDTLIVYDHVVVYDTIKVYDTLIVYDTLNIPDKNFFEKNNSIQNPTLVIDTAKNELNLTFLFQKDTATIPINSINLSGTNIHLDTMKKEFFTLAAAALISQAAISQNDTLVTSKKDLVKTYEVIEKPYSVKAITFRKKKNHSRTYRITLPTTPYIPETVTATGYYHSALITDITDSLVKIKFRAFDYSEISSLNSRSQNNKVHHKKRKEYREVLKNIRRNVNMSAIEKENEYFKITYTDSVSVPLSSITKMRFSRFNSSRKKFNNTFLLKGFNEDSKLRFCRSAYNMALAGVLIATEIGIPAWIQSTATGSKKSRFSRPEFIAGAVVVSTIPLCFSKQPKLFTKKIDLRKWEIVPQSNF